MSTFFFFAFLLLVLSLAVLLYGLTKPVNPGCNPVDVNVEIAKENKRALEHALASGELTQEGFDVELQQLESALANNISAAPTMAANSRGQWAAAGLMILGIPLAAGLLYLKLGTPGAINAMAQKQQATAEPTSTEGMPPLAELLPNVERRLQENPDDLKGWKLLGRSYLMIGNFDKAVAASRRALELDDQDPDILAQLAESVAMQQAGDMQGEPIKLANAALALNPDHQQSVWLSAIADQQQGEHRSAIEKFESLLPAAQSDAGSLASINEMLAVSKAALGEAAPATAKPTTAPAVAGSAIKVRAVLSASIAPNLPDTTSVFIYARASSGPPMPLAVAKLQLKDLPIEVTLDDSMAMVPDMTISAFSDVVIGARISPSGNAIRQPGDWMGETVGVKVGSQEDAVLVTIDKQVE
ncbi:MAG: c-type cytochrome biogenesis protein CcmI [Granulosicoccaceae bacterium]